MRSRSVVGDGIDALTLIFEASLSGLGNTYCVELPSCCPPINYDKESRLTSVFWTLGVSRPMLRRGSLIINYYSAKLP